MMPTSEKPMTHRECATHQASQMHTRAARMVTIGLGRQDPRQWVKAAYAVTDAMQCGQTGPRVKLPARTELARILGVHYQTVARAYQELTGMGIIYIVPGHGYYPTREPGSDCKP
jgi:DNA-binding GntR family transcriptional regulator